jgi:hypothetical protein
MYIILPNGLGMKKNYWVVLGGGFCLLLIASLIYFKIYKSQGSKPQPMAHSLEYNAIVDEHIDIAKVPRNEIDIAVTKQELGQRLTIYQFNHPKLRGKWGDLYVFVDRQTGKSVSRSLLPVNKARPTVTPSNLPECLMVDQPDRNSYEICIR